MTVEIKENEELRVSELAENLVGSEIIALAAKVREKIQAGEHIYNLTIGDFNPEIFPIPQVLSAEIIKAYEGGQTNYPPSNGIPELRSAVSAFIERNLGLSYSPENILISGGARPLIYATYKALIDPGDKIIFPVPSWNNNHYTHLASGTPVLIEAKPENNFMPTPEDIEPHIKEATLISLCSPLNPTGTTFSKENLERICRMVVSENLTRNGKKPLYLLYDQIYWTLTHGETKHYDPVSLVPEIKNYTIYMDGISKAFAATGVRVGWALGPEKIIDKMKSILGHVGAWSPKAEQTATAVFLNKQEEIDKYLLKFKSDIHQRLNLLYQGLTELENEGLNVKAISPQAAIYLTVQIDLIGKTTKDGKVLETTQDIADFLINYAQCAFVPFYAFGSNRKSAWFRLSIGTITIEDISGIISNLRKALNEIS